MNGKATLLHLLPFLGLGLVILFAGVIAWLVGLEYPTANSPRWELYDFARIPHRALALEAQARVAWELAMLFLLIAVAAALVGSSIVIATSLRRGDTTARQSFYWAVAIAGIPAAVGLVTWACCGGTSADSSLTSLYKILQPQREIKTLTDLTILLGGVTILLLVIGFSACLLPVPVDKVAAQRTLLHQTRRLRWLLYLSAAVLAGATLEVSTLYAWPASLAVKAEDHEAMLRIGGSYAVGAGTTLTLLLIAGYGPTVIVLRHRVLQFAEHATETADPQVIGDWLKQQGMESTHAQLLMRVLATISPLIAGGPFTHLLNQMSS